MEENILTQCGLSAENAGVYAANGWLKDKNASRLISFNPSTEQPLASIYTATPDQFDLLLQQSQQSFLSWSQIPAPKRGECIRILAEKLRKNKSALGSLIALETGKIKVEGDGEVQEMIDIADFAVGLSRMLYGKTIPSERLQHRILEQWHPLGIIAVITAFNFPMAVWAWNAFIAAVCGNVVIWKPSSKTPLCAIAVQHICDEAMRECGYNGIFSLCITENKTIAEQLLNKSEIALVSFTGSSAVGHHVAETVSRRFGKYLLECSGNNAIIVDESADLHLAIPSIVFGAVGTAGQRCTSTRRLFVHANIYVQVINALKNAYQQIRIGDPLNAQYLMGPLIDKEAVNHYQSAIAAGQKQGGKLLYGGKLLPGPGHYVEPVIMQAENHWAIVQQETFAPILYVMKFTEISEAIVQQNAVPQGLSSAIFTQNLSHAEQFLSAQGSDCGMANVNIGTSGAEIGGAFGGEKETGGGREAGSDAWKNYMRRQTNTINWGTQLPLAQGIKFDISLSDA